MTLRAEHLAERIADVHRSHIATTQAGRRQRPVDHLTRQVGEVPTLARQVPGEIALVRPDDPDVLSHTPMVQLTE